LYQLKDLLEYLSFYNNIKVNNNVPINNQYLYLPSNFKRLNPKTTKQYSERIYTSRHIDNKNIQDYITKQRNVHKTIQNKAKKIKKQSNIFKKSNNDKKKISVLHTIKNLDPNTKRTILQRSGL
jgi:predicted nucleotidyltransferase